MAAVAKQSQHHVQDEELGILLMGITGHGKSATGNSILMREEFKSVGGWNSVTKTYHVGHTRFGGKILKVVDIPGFADSDQTSDSDKLDIVVEALSEALIKFPNGFHAVLLVISYSIRITEEVRSTLNFIFDEFDKNAFKSHGVLVVTSGDAFERDNEKNEVPTTLKNWLLTNFPERLAACGGRCVLFDNVTRDYYVKCNQVSELLKEINTMDNKNASYMPAICRYHGPNAKEFELNRQRAIQNELAMSQLGLLKYDLLLLRIKPMAEQKKGIDVLKTKVASIRGQMESNVSLYHQSTFDNLRRIEIQVAKGDLAMATKNISNTQLEIHERSKQGTWWDNTKRGVNEFVQGVRIALSGAKRAVGATAKKVGKTIFNFFFG